MTRKILTLILATSLLLGFGILNVSEASGAPKPVPSPAPGPRPAPAPAPIAAVVTVPKSTPVPTNPLTALVVNSVGNQIGRYLSNIGVGSGILQALRVLAACPQCALVGLA